MEGDKKSDGNFYLLHRKCKQAEYYERNCRALSDRSQAECFRASPDSEADAAHAAAVSGIALAHSFVAGPAAYPYRHCRLAVLFPLLGI